jgi:hypothetical protein
MRCLLSRGVDGVKLLSAGLRRRSIDGESLRVSQPLIRILPQPSPTHGDALGWFVHCGHSAPFNYSVPLKVKSLQPELLFDPRVRPESPCFVEDPQKAVSAQIGRV